MTFDATILTLDEPSAQARWQALEQASPQRSPFSTLSYARRAAEAYNLRCRMHLITAKGQDTAGAILFWRRRGPYREVRLPPFTQYSALLLRGRSSEADAHARTSCLEMLLDALENAYDRLDLMATISDVRPANWRRWRVQPLYTYTLALASGPITAHWSSSAERIWRRHQKGFRVEEGGPAPAQAVVSLCQESYRRHGRALPGGQEALLALVRNLQRDGHARLFTARRHGQDAVEAGLAVLLSGDTACYWIAGSAPGPAMTVLLGRVLPLLAEAGVAHFDFVGANTPSIAEFKRRFGPRLTPYYHLQKTTRPELRLLFRITGKR